MATNLTAMTAMSSTNGTTLGKNLLSQEGSAPQLSFARGAEFGQAKFDDERTPFGAKVIGADNRKRPDMNTYFSEKQRPDNAFGKQNLSQKEQPGMYTFYRGDSLEKTKEMETKLKEKVEETQAKMGKNVGPGSYNTDETDKTRREARAPAFTMGEPSKYVPNESQIKAQTTPGAGQYSVMSATIKNLPGKDEAPIAGSTLGRNKMAPHLKSTPAYSVNNNVGKPRQKVFRKKKFKSLTEEEIDVMKGRHAFKKQVLSTQKSSHGYTMRPPVQLPPRLLKKMADTKLYPGPDKSANKTTFGKQQKSSNRSGPSYGFGPGFQA